MADAGAKRLHVFTARMPADRYRALRHYANLTSQSINQVIVTAVTRFIQEEVGTAAFDAMVEEVREEFRSALDSLDDR